MYKRYKLKVFILEFSDSMDIWAKHLRASDWSARSAKNPQHGSKRIRGI